MPRNKRIVILIALLAVVISYKYFWIFSIEIYQKFLSPYKGYHCAYAQVYPGTLTCSAYGKSRIQKHGVIIGLRLLNERFKACTIAARQLDSLKRRQEFLTGNVKN